MAARKMYQENYPLCDLIEQGKRSQAMELLKGSHRISPKDINRSLMAACRRGYTCIVQTLLHREASVDYRDTSGNTPLLVAVEDGFTGIAEMLLEGQADVNASNCAGDTALILSTCLPEPKDMVNLLLRQAGIDINHQNNDSYTAVMKSAEVNDVDTVKLLLDAYYKLDIQDMLFHEENTLNGGEHVIHWKTLDETVNCKGETALAIAEKSGIGNVFQLLKRCKMSGVSPLELAAEEWDMKSFGVLLHCDFVYTTDMRKCVDDIFTTIFKSLSGRCVKQFKDNNMAMIQALLKCGADVNASWYDDKFLYRRFPPRSQRCYGRLTDPLVTSSKLGCYNIIELLLAYKADANRYDFPNSALHFALTSGHIDCAKLLIQHGARLDIQQALEISVDQQVPKYLNFLFDNYKQTIMKYFSDAPCIQNDLLISAVKGGNLEIIGLVLDTGVDINNTIFPGVTPLAESKNGEVAQFLIDRGADVNHATSIKCKGQTPLLEVLIDRYKYDCCAEKVIEVLLENGAYANVASWNGETPLIVAALKEGSSSVLQLLIDHGAELSGRDEEGNTALMHAALEGCSQNVSFLLQLASDKLELLNVQNQKGLTALMCAVSCRNITIIKEMVKAGADVNIKDRKGNTALIHSLSQFPVPEDDVPTLLIQTGSDVNHQNADGLSPLMLAAKNCFKQTMAVLLEAEADINAVSKKDHTKTALTFLLDITHLGCDLTKDHITCMDYLLNMGANSAYLSSVAFHKIIATGHAGIIPKLINSGLPPVDISSREMMLIRNETASLTSYSPLCSALMAGNTQLARYFLDHLYLTCSDVPAMANRNSMRLYLERKEYTDCLSFLNEVSTDSLTLFNLSFVAVSTAVGATPARQGKVRTLPLPQIIRDKLIFQSQGVLLSVSGPTSYS